MQKIITNPTKKQIRQLLDSFYYNHETDTLHWKVSAMNGIYRKDDIVNGSSHPVYTKNHHIITRYGYRFFYHDVVWLICTGKWRGQELNHINKMLSDNTIGNLQYPVQSKDELRKQIKKLHEKYGEEMLVDVVYEFISK